MNASKIIISPKTRVGELLDNYPELESVLIQMSPAFEKLKNPVLRKTVARVATLQQIAAVGGLKVEDIVNKLRKETGLEPDQDEKENVEYFSVAAPEWYDKRRIISRFDATAIINSGGSPMNDILRLTNSLNQGEIFELTTPFLPAPILDMLKAKNFRIYCIKNDTGIISYIEK